MQNLSQIISFLYLPGKKSNLHSTHDAKVLDGAVIVYCLPTSNVSTFDKYAEQVFIPHIDSQLQDTQRLYIVWDEYLEDILKESTWDKRGKGVGRKVFGSAKILGN